MIPPLGVAQSQALPEPLTLPQALSASRPAAHPELLAAAAEQDLARAEQLEARAATGLRAALLAEGRYVQPSPLAPDPGNDDSRASLVLSKRLYDFGRTRSATEAAEARVESRSQAYVDARYQQRLAILRRYLDVLLADLDFRVRDEAMAIAYVRLDEMRDRHELGRVSDVALLEQETDYQEVRIARYRAQSRQRTARVRLAEAMGRPGELARTLLEPALSAADRELPELDRLRESVLQNNPQLLAARAAVTAASERLDAARAGRRPILSGEVETSEYAKEFGSRDEWRASLILEVPLLTGGAVQADVARARARLRLAEARRAREELRLRETVAELWEEIQVLQAQREEAWTRQDYRELYLDRSRALYELEVETDLGDAMVESTAARLEAARVDYQLLLAWEQLDALRGKLPLAELTRTASEQQEDRDATN